jgi:hypothetical protein
MEETLCAESGHFLGGGVHHGKLSAISVRPERHPSQRDLGAGQDPESDYRCGRRRHSASHKDLPQFTNACLAPKAPIHPQVVEDDQANGTHEENVRQNHPQAYADPPEVLKANRECDYGCYNGRCGIQKEEMSVSHPLRKDSLQSCHVLACW